jgi:hypothetical protein
MSRRRGLPAFRGRTSQFQAKMFSGRLPRGPATLPSFAPLRATVRTRPSLCTHAEGTALPDLTGMPAATETDF